MNFIAYEISTDDEGMHFVSAFDYNNPERQFAHYDRCHEYGNALDLCNDISEADSFGNVEEIEASGDWEELSFDGSEICEEALDQTPDLYELLAPTRS